MKNIPIDAKPRERMKKFGVKNLATHELLAILLRTGTKQENVLSLATRLMQHFGDLYHLKIATLEELQEIKGIGKVKAIELKAALELGVRIFESQQLKYGSVCNSDRAGKIFIQALSTKNQEYVMVIFLNTKHEIIRQKIMFIGSVNHSIADPRDIYREAVKCGASRFIIGHNHPSGNPDPSHEDIHFTKRLKEGGELIGIDVLDHIVVGGKNYISLKEKGYI